MKDKGTLKFEVDMPVDEFLDQYVMWRLKDILRFESDPAIRKAARELKAYFAVPYQEGEDDGGSN